MKTVKKSRLRNTNPQKYCLKVICTLLYYFGVGECWYEDSPRRYQKHYVIWSIISNSYMLIVYLDELSSHFRDDLTPKERHDLIQFSIAHSTICAKIIALYLYKNRIKVVMERLLEENRNVFPSLELDKQAVKTAMRYFIATAGVVFLTLGSALVDAVITHFKEGIPVRTEVTYYPTRKESGWYINILRFLIEFHWWYIVTVMVLIDGISICSLTFTGFKFRRVRLYFESLRGRFTRNPQRKLNDAEEKQFRQDFVVGIKLHEDALCCARNVQHALGNVYSIQIVESIGILVICLIKLVTIERNITLLLANLAFTFCLVVITGAYMMDAAEITHEASLVSTAIFQCGWEFVSPRAGLRTLVVLAIQRSQVPVHMTAFGVITLSYSNFITVLRSSYSFFAVMF